MLLLLRCLLLADCRWSGGNGGEGASSSGKSRSSIYTGAGGLGGTAQLNAQRNQKRHPLPNHRSPKNVVTMYNVAITRAAQREDRSVVQRLTVQSARTFQSAAARAAGDAVVAAAAAATGIVTAAAGVDTVAVGAAVATILVALVALPLFCEA